LGMTLALPFNPHEGPVAVAEFDFNCSRLRRPWYPPLPRTKGWGASVVVIRAETKGGPLADISLLEQKQRTSPQ